MTLYSRFLKAQDDLLKLVKNQENRHEMNRKLAAASGSDADLCDLLQGSMSHDHLQVLNNDGLHCMNSSVLP